MAEESSLQRDLDIAVRELRKLRAENAELGKQLETEQSRLAVERGKIAGLQTIVDEQVARPEQAETWEATMLDDLTAVRAERDQLRERLNDRRAAVDAAPPQRSTRHVGMAVGRVDRLLPRGRRYRTGQHPARRHPLGADVALRHPARPATRSQETRMVGLARPGRCRRTRRVADVALPHRLIRQS